MVLPESVISMQISGAFYQRMRLLLFNLISDKTEDEIKNALEKISKNEHTNESWMVDYETLLIFVKEFERIAEEENQFKLVSPQELEQYILDNIKKDQDQPEDQV